jgi:hypothetical protein
MRDIDPRLWGSSNPVVASARVQMLAFGQEQSPARVGVARSQGGRRRAAPAGARSVGEGRGAVAGELHQWGGALRLGALD